jgi:hypothetical protein
MNWHRQQAAMQRVGSDPAKFGKAFATKRAKL